MSAEERGARTARAGKGLATLASLYLAGHLDGFDLVGLNANGYNQPPQVHIAGDRGLLDAQRLADVLEDVTSEVSGAHYAWTGTWQGDPVRITWIAPKAEDTIPAVAKDPDVVATLTALVETTEVKS